MRRVDFMKALISLGATFYKTYPYLSSGLRAMNVDVCELTKYDIPTSKEEIIEQIKDVDIYIVGVEKVDKEVIDAAKNLKLVIKHGAGYNNIDVEYATEKGIYVTFAKGQNAVSVAELAMGLILSSARDIVQADIAVKADNWKLFMGDELEYKTLGLIGCGAIGKEVAKRAKAFDMKVLAYDVYQDDDAARKIGIEYVELATLFSESDYISLHIPAFDENYKFMNLDKFSKMKKSSYFINTSRGEVVDEDDLIYALTNGIIKAAAIDVYQSEPPRKDLLMLRNLITTPHIGGCSIGGAKRLAAATLENVRRFLIGEELLYLLNPQVKER